MKAPDTPNSSSSAARRSSGWIGLLGWGIGRRLGLAAVLLIAIWAAVYWALA
ncbi:hypothetical protein [Fodinicurvata sp. EGI_FJ10296]|uniref:hypothetical protein n=1 Tax=Fodinicurvata sp. EGI_FJ10296 TaxID=3231908 RepID=UPI00345673BE